MLKKYPLLLIGGLTFCLYFTSFFNQFVWDDEQFIYKNVYVQNLAIKEIFTTNTIAGAGEISNYYRPLTTLSFALDYQFWGVNPFGYHLVNTLLHIAAGLLIYKLLQRLQFSQVLCFIASLVFLVHPLQTEAVTYINSRGDSLYAFFLMLSLVAHSYLFQKKPVVITLYQYRWKLNKLTIVLLTAAAYLCSILSKEIALAGLGLHALLIVRYFLLAPANVRNIFKQFTWPLATFFSNTLIVSFYLGLRATILNFQNTFNFFNDTSLYSESLLVRLLTFFKIIFIYIKLVIFPYPLHMERTTEIITSPVSFWPVAFSILVIFLAAVSFWQWKKFGRTTIVFGWAWITIMLIPVSGIIAINGLLYEHWLYLPLVGFCIVIYEVLNMFVPKLIKQPITKYFFITMIIIFSVLTIRQNYFWSTPIRLYTHLLKYTDSARIHNNLAMALSEDGQYQKALEHFFLALEYGIKYPQIYHNMGNTYSALGDLTEAELSYRRALEISPVFFHSYTNLINIYLERQKYDQAVKVAHLAQDNYPEAVEYQLLELKIYAIAQDTNNFERLKAELIMEHGSESAIYSFISKLQLLQ